MSLMKLFLAAGTLCLVGVSEFVSPVAAGEFYGNYRTSYAPVYSTNYSGPGWSTYYFGSSPSYSSYGMTSGYAWAGNSCNSCQTANYAVSPCDCSPCGACGCSGGNCATGNCANGNCASGNCTTNLAPSGPPTPIADPNPTRPADPTPVRTPPPRDNRDNYEPIPSREPAYTPPPRNTFEEPAIRPRTPMNNPMTTPLERDQFGPRNDSAPMFDSQDSGTPLPRNSVPMGRAPAMDPMDREPFTPNANPASGGIRTPAGTGGSPAAPMRSPAPTNEPSGGTNFDSSFRPSYSSEETRKPSTTTETPAADAEKPTPNPGDSSMKIPAPIDLLPVSPANEPSAQPLNLDRAFVTVSVLPRTRQQMQASPTLPAMVRTVVRPSSAWDRAPAPQISVATNAAR